MVYEQDPMTASTLMFSLQRDIDNYKDVIDWADIAQPGVHKMFSDEARAEEEAKGTAVETGDPKVTSEGFNVTAPAADRTSDRDLDAV